MQKTLTQLPEIRLIGITCRTSNMNEMNPSTRKISSITQKYFYEHLSENIPNRKTPGTTYCIYTNYESDFTGDYTYFIGEEVNSFEEILDGFGRLTIPAQTYVKFTNGPGSMPDICIRSWQEIWAMTSIDLGGKRRYVADFEIYDERANDPQNVTLDIYIGIDLVE